MLSVENLVKTFQGPEGVVRALDGVSLQVADGELATVRGPSGCGKTTLLLAVGGLLHPDSGTVRVDEVNPYALAAEPRARFRAALVGFVFQQFYLVPYLTVLENILTPALARSSGAQTDRARELIREFGLEHRARHLPAELSAGERQRTALARALLNSPRLLLADEPTGNLDDRNAQLVLEHLARFAESGGTVLLASHDARGTQCARQVLDMERGQLLTRRHEAPQPSGNKN